MIITEVCANSLRSAIIAQQCGAQRIELCQNLMVGGTTPSAATIQLCRDKLDIDIFVLLRPRAGDFVYSELEMEIILKNIAFCKKIGVDGIVIGVLQNDGSIDTEKTKAFVAAAGDMNITFHRAFDYVPNPLESLEQLIQLKVNRILTSGQQHTAIEGKALIAKLVMQANDKISILAGSGINIDNVEELIQTTQVKEIHLSAKSLLKSTAKYRSSFLLNNSATIPEHDYFLTDEGKLRRVLELVRKL
ncbi:MAG TPA: copper homeostasis protein CutC [Saprospiraceae bacterium]|nr:copper homeostasis protein CutC [Saprospiraceae bacterium]